MGQTGKPTCIMPESERNLKPIKQKLRGFVEDGTAVSVPNHVDSLIKSATSASNLVSYRGSRSRLINIGFDVPGLGAMAVSHL